MDADVRPISNRMELLIIFAAKYLIVLPALLVLWTLFKAPPEKRKEILLFAAITLPLSYVLALIARHFYVDPRPFTITGIAPLIPHAPDNGFPSDHTLLAAALAAVVGYCDKKMALIVWLTVLLIGGARVMAGVHHMTDIVGSIVLVVAAAGGARAIMRRIWNKNTSLGTT